MKIILSLLLSGLMISSCVPPKNATLTSDNSGFSQRPGQNDEEPATGDACEPRDPNLNYAAVVIGRTRYTSPVGDQNNSCFKQQEVQDRKCINRKVSYLGDASYKTCADVAEGVEVVASVSDILANNYDASINYLKTDLSSCGGILFLSSKDKLYYQRSSTALQAWSAVNLQNLRLSGLSTNKNYSYAGKYCVGNRYLVINIAKDDLNQHLLVLDTNFSTTPKIQAVQDLKENVFKYGSSLEDMPQVVNFPAKVTDQDLRDVKMVDASTGTVSYGTILPTKDGIISLTIAPDKAYAVMHTDISRHTTVGTYPAYGQILMLDQVESTSNPPLYLCAFHQSTSQSNNRSYFFCDKLTTAIKLPADALTTPLYMVRYQWANFQQKLYLVSLAVDSAADPTNNTANYRAAIFEYSYTASGNSLVPSLQSKAQVSFTGKNTVQGTVWQNLLMALIKHNPQANSSQQLVLTPEQDQLILGQVDPTYTETKLARITSKVAAISSFPQALNYFNSDLASGEGVWMAEGQWNAKSYHKANRLIATTTLRDHLAITNLNQRQSYRPQLMENAQDEDALTVLGAPIFVGDDLYFVGKMNAETSPDKPTTAKNVQLFKVRLSNLK